MKIIIQIDNMTTDKRTVEQDHNTAFLAHELDKILEEMQPKLKTILLAFMAHEFTCSDAAKALGISKPMFRMWLHKAKREFRIIAHRHGIFHVYDFSIQEHFNENENG